MLVCMSVQYVDIHVVSFKQVLFQRDILFTTLCAHIILGTMFLSILLKKNWKSGEKRRYIDPQCLL